MNNNYVTIYQHGHRVPPFIIQNNKDKAIPLQAWTGPEVSRRLRLPDVQTIDT